MSGVSAPVVIAYLAIAAGATGWHMASEHYVHLVWLRVIEPDTKVPDVSHRSWWHAMPHWKRLGAHAAMAGAAILAGLAWELSPYVAAAVIIGSGVTGTILVLMRRAGGAGTHSHEHETSTTEGSGF